MCGKCNDIDEKIARYKRLSDKVLDRQFEEAVVALVADLEAEKARLHPGE